MREPAPPAAGRDRLGLLTASLAAGFLALGLLAVAAYVGLDRELSRLEAHDAALQALAEQRLAAARVAASARRLAHEPPAGRASLREELGRLADRLEQHEAALAVAPGRTSAQAGAGRESVAAFLGSLREVLRLPDEQVVPEHPALGALLGPGLDQVRLGLEGAMAAFQAAAGASRDRCRVLQAAVAALTLLLLVLLAALVARPLVRRARHGAVEAQELEAFASAVVAAAGDGILVMEHGGLVRSLNPAGGRILHVDPAAAVGARIQDLVPALAEIAAGSTPSGGGVFHETTLYLPDGGRLSVDVTVTPLQLRRARLLLLVLHDVTPRKRVEEELTSRVEHVQGLHDMAAGMMRAANPDEIYGRALAGLERVMGAERSALLLFEHGVARFKAWHGLSDQYRARVEGDSPWRSTLKAAEPVLVGDVLDDASIEPHRAALVAEHVRSLAYVPLFHEGRILGKLVVYFAEPHVFGEAQVRVAQSIAAQVAFAIVRQQQQDALVESEERMRLALESARAGAWDYEVATGRVRWSPELEDLFGIPRGSFGGTLESWIELVHPDDRAQAAASVQVALAGRADHFIEHRVPRPDGSVRWLAARGRVHRDAAGRALVMSGIAVDVTERRHAETAQRFLSDASATLAASLDMGATVQTVAGLAVPHLADWCAVDLRTDGTLERVASRRAPGVTDDEDAAAERACPDGRAAIDEVLNTGESSVLSDPPEGLLSVARIPLPARGRILGVLTLATTTASRRRLDAAGVALAEETGRRAALALDNARLHRETQEALTRHRVAEERLARLADASARLLGTLEPEAIEPSVVELARGLVPADAHALVRWDAAARAWRVAASTGLSPEFSGRGTLAPAPELLPDQPVVIVDDERELGFAEGRDAWLAEGIGALLLLPLSLRGRRNACLACGFRNGRRLSEPELRVATALASLAASALATAELYEDQSLLRAEAEAARERFSALVNSIDAIVWEAHPVTGRFTFVSQRTQSILGHPPSRWMSAPDAWEGDVHPDDLDQARAFRRALAAGADGALECRFLRADGQVAWIRDIGRAVRGPEGQVLQVQGLMLDVTSRRAVEDALRSAHESLEAKAAQLVEANQELSQYAYVVSHDLKTPLRAVHNYADFLREDLTGRLSGEQAEYLDALGRAVRQAEVLVEDLLELSRIGSQALRHDTLHLGRFLRELTSTLDLPPDAQVEMVPEWPVVEGDPVLLKQVFENLILNGLKFNRSPLKRVWLTWSAADSDSVDVEIRDNGIGIDPRFHEQVFGVFQRLHPAHEYEGTGIGLAIVRKAVSRLGGSIRLRSAPGEGTTFTVRLPLSGTGRPEAGPPGGTTGAGSDAAPTPL